MSQRVCAAIIRDRQILMVHHRHDGQDYWTLPGGAVEAGESLEVAARREVTEETGLHAQVLRALGPIGNSDCFLMTILDDGDPVVGYDPKLPVDGQIITDVRWFALAAVADDMQVRDVIAYLAPSS